MKQIAVKELNRRIDLAQKVAISDAEVDTKTRSGLYITIRTGMTHDIFFVGKDLSLNKNIIEML